MQSKILITTFVALSLGTVAGRAVDLVKVDRTIVKEPVYRTPKPQYCLLVFGPEAKTRVWLVYDGDVMYLDRNGNGDLTEAGERLELKAEDSAGYEAFRAKLGTVAGDDSKARYRILYVRHKGFLNPWAADAIVIEVRPGLTQYAALSFADRPQKAPVFHFDGPLELQPAPQDIKNGLIRGSPANHFRIVVGTPTSERSWVYVESEPSFGGKFRRPSAGFPKERNPIVDIEFPNRVADGQPIKCRYTFKERC